MVVLLNLPYGCPRTAGPQGMTRGAITSRISLPSTVTHPPPHIREVHQFRRRSLPLSAAVVPAPAYADISNTSPRTPSPPTSGPCGRLHPARSPGRLSRSADSPSQATTARLPSAMQCCYAQVPSTRPPRETVSWHPRPGRGVAARLPCCRCPRTRLAACPHARAVAKSELALWW